jgi:hypothetical protein
MWRGLCCLVRNASTQVQKALHLQACPIKGTELEFDRSICQVQQPTCHGVGHAYAGTLLEVYLMCECSRGRHPACLHRLLLAVDEFNGQANLLIREVDGMSLLDDELLWLPSNGLHVLV